MKKTTNIGALAGIIFALAPAVVLADSSGMDFGWLKTSLTRFSELLGTIVPILISLAVLVFVWGLVRFIFNQGDEKAKTEGKQRMVWGIIAIFVMVSIWGFVSVLQGLFGFSGGGTPISPPVPTASS